MLVEKHAKISSKGKHDMRVAKAVKEAKDTAFGVYEYTTHSSYNFAGYDEFTKKAGAFCPRLPSGRMSSWRSPSPVPSPPGPG